MFNLFSYLFGSSKGSTENSSKIISDTVDDSMHKLIFMPPMRDPEDIERLALDPQFELRATMNLETKELISMLCATPKPNNVLFTKCIIFSHGNAGDILSYADYAKKIAALHGVLFIIYDYPGYGLSEGKATETSSCKSLELVIKYVKRQLNFEEKDITLIGQSIGTGIVANYAANHSWKTPIVLISPYESIISVVCYSSCVSSRFGTNRGDSSMDLPFDKLKTYAAVDDIQCPVKLIHGEADEVIDIKHSKSLYSSLGSKAMDPLWLKNIGHNDILDAIPFAVIDNVIHYKPKN